jgi:hypothetical protein
LENENLRRRKRRDGERTLSVWVHVCERDCVVRTQVQIQTDIDASKRCYVCMSMNLRFYRRFILLDGFSESTIDYVDVTVVCRNFPVPKEFSVTSTEATFFSSSVPYSSVEIVFGSLFFGCNREPKTKRKKMLENTVEFSNKPGSNVHRLCSETDSSSIGSVDHL